MFIYTRVYSAAISGREKKLVHCEKCGCHYGYIMVRRGFSQSSSAYGIGNASAEATARKRANKKMLKGLANDSDPVGCPGCGWIQMHMVSDMRSRAHQWLRWVAWVTLAIGIVCAIMGVLAATNGLSRSMEPEQAGLAAIIMLVTFAIFGGSLFGRSMLAGLIDPNRHYPQRPAPIPGAPQPIKLERNGNELIVASSSPPLAPVTSADADPKTLAYESKPLQVEPGGWVTVQLLNYRNPSRCSCCMRATQSLRIYKCGRLASVQLPLCEQCRAYYKGEKLWICAVAILAGAAVGLIGAIALDAVDGRGVALMAISCAIALLGGLWIAVRRAAPAQFSRFSPSLNTVRIRFRNRCFLNAVLESGRLV